MSKPKKNNRRNRHKNSGLIPAKKKVVVQSKEKQNLRPEIPDTEAIVSANKVIKSQKLKKAKTELKKVALNNEEDLDSLKKMMYITSHEIRRPVTNLQGILNALEDIIRSPAKLKEMLVYMKQSVQAIDNYTKKLTEYIHNQSTRMRTRKKNN